MVKGVLRAVWLLSAFSIIGLTLPARVGMSAPVGPRSHDCCGKAAAVSDLNAGNARLYGHCGGEPAKSQERQCCAGCTLSLINVLPPAYVFSRNEGRTLLTLTVNREPLSARPPVPPPRV